MDVEFLKALPKTDLHVHLDGSLRLSTLFELAKEYGVELPADTEEGMRAEVFKPTYESLAEYLRGFAYTVAVLQSEVALERVAYELAQDNQAEGVRYLEVRFAPQLHVHSHLDVIQVIKAVNRGLERARDEFNRRQAVVDALEPPFEYGIICSALRMFRAEFSEYYRQIMAAHKHAPPREVYRLASLELCRAAVIARDAHGLPVVGFDLAGEEHGYPAVDHTDAFAFAHRNFLKKTVHAGEAYGPESIFQAITELNADRIGHGTYLLDPTAIQDLTIEDPERYVSGLAEYIADRRVTLEVCLSSNAQTAPSLRDISKHPFRELRAHRLSATLCTDNRLISTTTMTKELQLAVDLLGIDRRDLKSIVIYGFKRSFHPGTYQTKRSYVRRMIDYYEAVEREFFG